MNPHLTSHSSGLPASVGDEDDTALKRVQFTLLLMTRWLEPDPLRARKARLGLKRVDVVETDADGRRVDYYLDPESHLPVKVVSATSSISRAEGRMNYEIIGCMNSVGRSKTRGC